MTKRPNTPFDLGFESGREASLFAWCTVSIAQTCSEINTLQRRHAPVGGTHTNDVGNWLGGAGGARWFCRRNVLKQRARANGMH